MPSPTGLRIVLFAAAAILVICMVPYLFPMAPVASPSYIFGNNNKVGSALFLLLAMLGAYWTRNCALPEIQTAPRHLPYSLLWITMAITLALSGAMAFLLTPHHGFQE